MRTRRETLGLLAAGAAAAALPHPARAQAMPKIVIGMSGWTGFAPLTLAEKAGLFKKHGVDAETKFIAQKERHLAMAAGAVQGIATTIDTHISYTAAGVELTQVVLLDRSKGGDGVAVRDGIKGFADLKGKTVACDGAGTTPYFTFLCMLKKNGMTARDLRFATLSPKDAANAFVAGQYDAAVTYEPYLSTIRNDPKAGRILATTVDYPVVVDTVAFQPAFIAANRKAVAGVVAGYFDALAMIKEKPDEAFRIMGERVNQTPDQFRASAQYIEWQDQAMNKAYFAKDMGEFMEMAAAIQLEAGVIRTRPDLSKMVDASFLA
jgi:NitT/TauT family transport system substrate-binding protein